MICHRSPISSIASHGDYVATAGYDNAVIIYDAGTKTPIARALHDHLVNHVSFSPCGDYLLTSSSDHTARVLRVPDLKLHAVLSDHNDDVEMAVFDPEGNRSATACRDHKVRIFSRTGDLLRELEGHDADVTSVAWSPDGRSVISSSDDGTVRRWDPVSGRQTDMFDLGGVETDTVVVGDDGTLGAGTDSGEIAIVAQGRTVKHLAHDAGIKRLLIDSASGRLANTGRPPGSAGVAVEV